ncbi:hypothetical protein DFS34DRAFT_620866 [Phlyctochytrium arcticum]|nr:hypothetical protein DFS34DRAFT_620866 [Phlyctochytrium arcticum]
MSSPPPYADAGSAGYPPIDSKHGIDTRAYTVVEGTSGGSGGIYPTAQDDVPPSVEPGWEHRGSSKNQVGPMPLQQQQQPGNYYGPVEPQQQQQQYQPQGQVPQQQQLQPTTNIYYTQPGVPVHIPGGPTVMVGGAAVNFHIYRDGWVSRDCRIVTGDKKAQAYHIEYPYSFFGAWHVNMRRTSSHGPTVFLITKSAMGWDFTIQDPANPQLTTKLTRSGGGIMGKRKHAFKGFDGKSYAWKGHGLGGDLKCVSYPSKMVVAFYHRTKHSWAKEGRLEILPMGQHILELLVATGFATEEWERQNR